MAKNITLDNVKKAYCIGIGGIGVSAAAKYLALSGVQVSGSDAHENPMLDELRDMGIPVFVGTDAKNVPDDADLVIYSPAVPDDNAEFLAAHDHKIPTVNYPKFLGMLSEKKKTIAITGTHGKSTVTAMIGLILKNAGFAPTVIVGSRSVTFSHGNLEMGESNILVVEACEYQGNMRELSPDIAVVTNVEYDHPDYYESADAIYSTMQEFVSGLSEKGVLIKNYDDKQVRARINWGGKTVLYGVADQADVAAAQVVMQSGTSYFTVTAQTPFGYVDERLSVRVPGRFNVSNALAAIAVANEMQVPMASIKDSLAAFTGIWRRFEVVGHYNGAVVVSDYAHHPTAVDATIRAARSWYQDHRLIVVFQPHQHARTKELFDDFVLSFQAADVTIFADIYDVAGREEDAHQDVSSKKLAAVIADKYPHSDVRYAGPLAEAEAMARELAGANDVVLVMGAGDIDQIARDLVD